MKRESHRGSGTLRRALAGTCWAAAVGLAPAVAAQGIELAAVPARTQGFAAAPMPAPAPFGAEQEPRPATAPESEAPVPGPAVPAEGGGEPAPVKMSAGPQVVQAFLQACVENGGAVTPAIDWALNHGFEPLDPEGRDGSDGHALLGGQPGVVFATPDAATRVLIAVTQDRNCTVWAERAAGTSTQDAFVQAAEAMTARGAQVRRETDRMLERAGAWRRQLEYRLRPASGSRDYRLGAVTTLTESPAAQALHFAPVTPPRVSASGEPAAPPLPAATPAATPAAR